MTTQPQQKIFLFFNRSTTDPLSVRYDALRNTVSLNNDVENENAFEFPLLLPEADPIFDPDPQNLRQFIGENIGKLLLGLFCVALAIIIVSVCKLIYSLISGFEDPNVYPTRDHGLYTDVTYRNDMSS